VECREKKEMKVQGRLLGTRKNMGWGWGEGNKKGE
jgi:hypothetical protein